MKILIINGPNLNLLGVREKDIYGDTTFESFYNSLKVKYKGDVTFGYFQSNVEGEIINSLHDARQLYDGVILNVGGYTHTSVAIADAVGAVGAAGLRTVEVHISNIMAREEFRHVSLIAPRCVGSIMGFGLQSYELGVQHFLLLKNA